MRVADVFGRLPTLETDRLILRPVASDDVADVFEYASDPEVARYVTWDTHESIDESRFFVDLLLGKYATGEVAPWAMVHRREGRLIGTCGFGWWNTTNRSAEIGYAMARRFWGQGLMTEAAREIVRFGFEVMNLNRIEACHDVDNPASGRVMEHVGMTPEGIRREAVFVKGYFRDLRLYSILRREYLG